jgi:hypothetical protein
MRTKAKPTSLQAAQYFILIRFIHQGALCASQLLRGPRESAEGRSRRDRMIFAVGYYADDGRGSSTAASDSKLARNFLLPN